MQALPPSDRYASLIRNFCVSVGMEDAAAVLDTGSMQVDGIPFSLYHHGTEEGDYLVLYCDFGTVPQPIMGQVFARLLEINLFLSGAVPPSCFTLNPDNGHVLLSYRCDLAQLDPPRLMECIHACVDQAQRFRAGHFLDEEAPPMPSASKGLFDLVAPEEASRRVAI